MQPEKDEVELTYFGGLRMKTQYTMFLSRELNLPAYKKNYGIFSPQTIRGMYSAQNNRSYSPRPLNRYIRGTT